MSTAIPITQSKANAVNTSGTPVRATARSKKRNRKCPANTTAASIASAFNVTSQPGSGGGTGHRGSQQWQKRDQRNRGHVLKQQDAESGTPGRRIHLLACLEFGDHHRGRRQRQCKPAR